MNKFRVWFTIGWSEEDYLDVEAKDADEAYENVMDANRDWDRFYVQSVETLD